MCVWFGVIKEETKFKKKQMKTNKTRNYNRIEFLFN